MDAATSAALMQASQLTASGLEGAQTQQAGTAGVPLQIPGVLLPPSQPNAVDIAAIQASLQVASPSQFPALGAPQQAAPDVNALWNLVQSGSTLPQGPEAVVR